MQVDPGTILIVDDDPLNRRLLAKSLENDGHRTAQFDNWYDGGSQGVVAHFRATHPTPTTFQVFLPAAHLTAISVHACNRPDEPPPGDSVCGAFESDDRIPAEGYLLNPA